MSQGSTENIRQRLLNALSILENAGSKAPDAKTVRRHLAMAVDVLKGAKQAIAELDQELEGVTEPELNAVRKVASLQRDLTSAKNRIRALEEELQMAKADVQVEAALHDEDRRRMKDLEKKARTLDKVLMEDDDAFDRFMDQAMDDAERKGHDGLGGR